MMMDDLNPRLDYNQLVVDVSQYIMEHIKATIDIEDVILGIEEIKKELNEIGG